MLLFALCDVGVHRSCTHRRPLTVISRMKSDGQRRVLWTRLIIAARRSAARCPYRRRFRRVAAGVNTLAAAGRFLVFLTWGNLSHILNVTSLEHSFTCVLLSLAQKLENSETPFRIFQHIRISLLALLYVAKAWIVFSLLLQSLVMWNRQSQDERRRAIVT